MANQSIARKPSMTVTLSPGRGGSATSLRRWLHLLLPPLLLGGCLSDRQLLRQNSTIALETATRWAMTDLNCPRANATIRNAEEVPATPMGRLWSRYTIQAAGCGRHAVYRLECANQRLCYAVDEDEAASGD